MVTTHNLGFPRIGKNRELKWAVENYWNKEITQSQLHSIGQQLRQQHWAIQQESAIDLIPVGDFSWYDHVLDTSILFGVIPERFQTSDESSALDNYFRMARGRAPTGTDTQACEMTKWFNTNYHYIVPELDPDQQFNLNADKLLQEIREAQSLGYSVKPVLLGPLSFLWLGKSINSKFDKLKLAASLVACYCQLLQQIADLGVEWIQIDEPILVLDLPVEWTRAFESYYRQLKSPNLKILLTTYFGGLEDNLHLALQLPTDGIHIDAVSDLSQLRTVVDQLAGYKVLSVGIIDGRNIWTSDLETKLQQLQPVYEQLGGRLWVAPSCSLIHCPVDVTDEMNIDPEIKPWLSFAVQKLSELNLLKAGLTNNISDFSADFSQNKSALDSRRLSPKTKNTVVRKRLATLTKKMTHRHSPFEYRRKIQQQILKLPLFPTTTIGSFPQTQNIRQSRQLYRKGELNEQQYDKIIQQQIAFAIDQQTKLGLDIFVHGEAERNDMVEYFGDLLEGFAITDNGWVQSYGSRCVKPPIIYGDIARPQPMTVKWIRYAQSLTDKPVKGMLTGPVTMLQWSFVRDDQSNELTCKQIALALRDEVSDLESAQTAIIQIDEAALREGLPLRHAQWDSYLTWATESFRICAAIAKNQTQIHTHMCYSEFNDIIEWIASLDADVITIETSRSHMALLDVFREYSYPNEIGPGTFDIHSPRIPTEQEIVALLEKGTQYIPAERLWVNPDCGLKTRTWPEVEKALGNMVRAAKTLRKSMHV